MKFLIVFQMLLSVFFCAAQPQSSLRKAITTPANVDSLISYEKPFTAHGSVAPPPGTNWFEFKKGERNILVTAPHATAQTREGKIKLADGGT
jgi:hypothetical protein